MNLEYPHCRDCSEYRRCKDKGFSIYKPKYLEFSEKCTDCSYDFNCTFDCPDYLELCLNDLEFARENSKKQCFKSMEK